VVDIATISWGNSRPSEDRNQHTILLLIFVVGWFNIYQSGFFGAKPAQGEQT
jgi:hypothetical protein